MRLTCCAVLLALSASFSLRSSMLSRSSRARCFLTTFCFARDRRLFDRTDSADTWHLTQQCCCKRRAGKGGVVQPGNCAGKTRRPDESIPRGCPCQSETATSVHCLSGSEYRGDQFSDFLGVFVQCECEPRQVQIGQIRKLHHQVQPSGLVCKIDLPWLVIAVTQVS